MATTLRKEGLEIRLNSEDDARAAVQNFIKIQQDAVDRGYSKVVFVTEQTLQQKINAILGTFFRRVKTAHVVMQAPPTREFYPLPHYKEPPAGTANNVVSQPAAESGVPLHIAQTAAESAAPGQRGGRPPRKEKAPTGPEPSQKAA